MKRISYTGEFVCPKCGRHTALVCHTDGTYQAHCMLCNAYYDVEIAKQTNADRIRSMTDEELAEFIRDQIIDRNIGIPTETWLDWLKQEVTANDS